MVLPLISNTFALEHSVPEQLFSTTEKPGYGVSAVKALQIAVSEGIPIYTITKDNIAAILPQLSLDSSVLDEIQNAVNAGKVVTVSKAEIAYNSFTGVGYIVIDPTTGEGAYMISGGESGGAFWPCAEYAFWHTAYVLAVATEYVGLAAGAALAALVFGPAIAAIPEVAASFAALVAANEGVLALISILSHYCPVKIARVGHQGFGRSGLYRTCTIAGL